MTEYTEVRTRYRVGEWLHWIFPPRHECVPALVLRAHPDGSLDIKVEVPPADNLGTRVLVSAGPPKLEEMGGILALAHVVLALPGNFDDGTLHPVHACREDYPA